MKRMRLVALAGLLASMGCTGTRLEPADLDTRNEACQNCRMSVSDRRFASQVVAPGEEARFFDDLACLTQWAAGQPALPEGAVAFVTDHRTVSWVPASEAVFTRVDSLETPMGSHLVAHASPESRNQDPAARGGAPVARSDVLGAMVARERAQ